MIDVIYVDLDNTLCSPISKRDAVKEVSRCKPYKLIKVINKLYKEYTIVIYTHRNNKCKDETIKWLKKYKVKYHKIKFNKPKYAIFIDDKALPPYEFLNPKYIESYINTIEKWNFNVGKFRTRCPK